MITALHALRTTTDNSQRAQSFTVGGCVTVAAAEPAEAAAPAAPSAPAEPAKPVVGLGLAPGARRPGKR
ncbi:hypothetical protein [Mycolicibacterium insubricum]|uniref:hypothetical protein n=1 Tax=Mycolicibacterium insubricum TaxID=444597 RepID=UPI0021F29EA9|nr:hypothetical protein [Mycolicibacterium insubricum]MCV7083621.1 hypothetical protein [Mycolicibacterium insubricum]